MNILAYPILKDLHEDLATWIHWNLTLMPVSLSNSFNNKVSYSSLNPAV